MFKTDDAIEYASSSTARQAIYTVDAQIDAANRER